MKRIEGAFIPLRSSPSPTGNLVFGLLDTTKMADSPVLPADEVVVPMPAGETPGKHIRFGDDGSVEVVQRSSWIASASAEVRFKHILR